MSSASNMKHALSAILICGTFCCAPEIELGPDAGASEVSGDFDADMGDEAGSDAGEDAQVAPFEPCLDADRDGYGINCVLGLDCDDDNADVNCATSCARRQVGCPCDEEGRIEMCRTFEPLDTIDGHDLCYQGMKTCRDGVWGPCENMSPFAFHADESSGSESGVERQPVLGYAEPCSGSSCDTSCAYVQDCLSAPDLDRDRAVNLIHDIRGAPAAVVLRDVRVNGRFHRAIESYCDTDEQVTWWALDFDLHADAPRSVTISVRTAESETALDSAAWEPVVLCPDGPCTRPDHPNDRDYGEGNLFDVLNSEDRHHPWIEIDVRLAAGGAETSPRYVGHWLYYYCDPPSQR